MCPRRLQPLDPAPLNSRVRQGESLRGRTYQVTRPQTSVPKIAAILVSASASRCFNATVSSVCCAVTIRLGTVTAYCMSTIFFPGRGVGRPWKTICGPCARHVTSAAAIASTIEKIKISRRQHRRIFRRPFARCSTSSCTATRQAPLNCSSAFSWPRLYLLSRATTCSDRSTSSAVSSSHTGSSSRTLALQRACAAA